MGHMSQKSTKNPGSCRNHPPRVDFLPESTSIVPASVHGVHVMAGTGLFCHRQVAACVVKEVMLNGLRAYHVLRRNGSVRLGPWDSSLSAASQEF
jgi:hypothetical protein